MPANLLSASPSLVLPNSLFTSFSETLSFPVLIQSAYHDNHVERSIIADGVNTPRALRSWTCTKRLTASQYTLLRAFWVTLDGGLRPFFFYPDPRQYDSSGNSSTGRINAVFVGDWNESRGPVMADVTLTIREVA